MIMLPFSTNLNRVSNQHEVVRKAVQHSRKESMNTILVSIIFSLDQLLLIFVFNISQLSWKFHTFVAYLDKQIAETTLSLPSLPEANVVFQNNDFIHFDVVN